MRAASSSPPPARAIASPRNVAQGFADHLNTVVNRTVSDARLSLLSRPSSATRFLIACVQDARSVPFALHGSPLQLHVEHEVDAADGKVHTASYRYVLQAGHAHDSWLVRWEYLRDRPAGYPYALGHVHVHADFADPPRPVLAKPLSRLHLPTARVAFELVLRHVIAEWGVEAKTDRWPEILDASLARLRGAPDGAVAHQARPLLGGGTPAPRTPVAVSGITDATAIGIGLYHSCGLHATGQVACWGYNVYGQLGNERPRTATARWR